MAYQTNTTNAISTIIEKAGLVKNSTPVVTKDTQRNTDWLNIGIKIDALKDEQGNPMIITLPMGVAIDNMKVTPVSNSDTAGAQAIRCRNALIEYLQDMFAKMPEGTRVELPMMVIQCYKAPAKKEVTSQEVNAQDEVKNVFKDIKLPF